MNLTYFDTETTGIGEDDVIIQLGLVNIVDKKVVHEINKFYNNGDKKISLISKSVHNITEDQLEGCPIFSSEVEEFKIIQDINNYSVFIAHNAPFDIGMVEKYGVKINRYIDTLQIAKHLLQEKEDEFVGSYKLGVLKYYLIEKGINFPELALHDAMNDVIILRQVFGYLFELTKEKFELSSNDEVIEKMLELTNSPILLNKINFGKHKGKTFEEIASNDPSYLDWLRNNADDENVRFTAGKWV